jgi:hypothetical protein
MPAVWEVFLTFGEVDYAQADATLVSQLDAFFQEGITSFFEPSTYQNIMLVMVYHLWHKSIVTIQCFQIWMRSSYLNNF